MKIGIVGTRGIPNNYGGFEQLTEYLSKGLVDRGHEVYVYNTHDHLYKESKWNDVNLIHKHNPEKRVGTFGQFIYDLLCIIDSRKRKYDVILQLGYTSSSVWGWLLPKGPRIVSNMDGLEWKRTKYNKSVQRFLMYAEKWAVDTSDYLISDSIGIQNYLFEKYNKTSQYIAYGAHIFNTPNPSLLDQYGVSQRDYNMLIARIEPENNIETILDGVSNSKSPKSFLVIGNCKANSFGRYLMKKFEKEHRIKFLGPIYNIEILNNLRYFSNLYFHGHSVGGTNPSLLEAMGSNCLICAHENPFNSSILEKDAFYFSSREDVSQLLDSNVDKEKSDFLKANLQKVQTSFLWDKIIDDYEKFLSGLVIEKKGSL